MSTEKESLSMPPWLMLAFAILSEVTGTTSMKLSDGFTKLVPTVLMVICYGLSLTLLSLTLRKLDVGLVYAIWSGVGTALIASIGVLWFKEPITAIKIISIALIILGIVGLNMGGGKH